MSGKSDEKSTMDIMMMVTKTSPSMLAFSQSSKKEKKTAVDGDVLKAIKDACDIAVSSLTVATAKITCTQAGGKDDFLYMVNEDGTNMDLGGLSALTKTDIQMSNSNCFKKCNKTVDKKCPGAQIAGDTWLLTDGLNQVTKGIGNPNSERSCMVCLEGGAIYFLNSGQKPEDFEETLEGLLVTSNKGIDMIANFEMSLDVLKGWNIGAFDANGNLLGIYPHYVFKLDSNGNYISDGGITLGYGHWISQKKYNTNASDKLLIDIYAPGASLIPSTAPQNGQTYMVPGSSYTSMNVVKQLFKEDIKIMEKAVNDFLFTNNIILKQNQFDALVSFTYQHGPNWWTSEDEKLLSKFIRNGNGIYDPEEVRDVFLEHDYDDRREIEADVFIKGY